MTRQELEKLSFEFRGNEYTKKGMKSAYYNKQYGIMVIKVERWSAKGLSISRQIRYNGKLYRKISDFLGVIKDVEFVA